MNACLLSSCVGKKIADVETPKQFEKFVRHFKVTQAKMSVHMGYVSRKIYGELYHYNGRYGKGVVLFTNSPKSTRYCYAIYYVREEE